MQKKITPKPRVFSQPRPIQDYLISKSRTKDTKPLNPSESLYTDAKSREIKQKNLQKSVNPNRLLTKSKNLQTIQNLLQNLSKYSPKAESKN